MRKLTNKTLESWKSITKKQKTLESKIVDKIEEYLESKGLMHKDSCFWFDDAAEGDIGTLSSSLRKDSIHIHYMQDYKLNIENNMSIPIECLFTQ